MPTGARNLADQWEANGDDPPGFIRDIRSSADWLSDFVKTVKEGIPGTCREFKAGEPWERDEGPKGPTA